MLKNLTYFLAFAIQNCCYGQSKIKSFSYGGLGDNMYSTIQGSVFFRSQNGNTKDTLLPLKAVIIIAYDSTGKLYKKNITDDKGSFTMEFHNAVYSIKFFKPGFQPLTITNYYSIADQISSAEIVLEEGTQSHVERIPDPVKN